MPAGSVRLQNRCSYTDAPNICHLRIPSESAHRPGRCSAADRFLRRPHGLRIQPGFHQPVHVRRKCVASPVFFAIFHNDHIPLFVVYHHHIGNFCGKFGFIGCLLFVNYICDFFNKMSIMQKEKFFSFCIKSSQYKIIPDSESSKAFPA